MKLHDCTKVRGIGCLLVEAIGYQREELLC